MRGSLLFLLLLSACEPDPILCKERTGGSREHDEHVLSPTGNPYNIVVVSMDTEPTKGSALLEANLQNLGYEYYLLGKTSTTGRPYPVKNGLFRQYIFSYKLFRYQEAVENLADDVIVLLTDASDVLLTQGPDVLAKRFKEFNKKIVITGEMGCCNINLLPWIEKLAKEVPIDDIRSMDPQTIADVQLLAPFVAVKGVDWGYGQEPVYLWTPEAQATMRGMKALEKQSKYRYLNSGGIIGRAKDLRQAFKEINPQDADDDQGRWSTWYIETGHPTGVATIDYHQRIFKVTNEIVDHDGDFRLLFDDFPKLPSRNEFHFVNDPDHTPMIYHCAGCSESQMQSFRRQIVKALGNFQC